MQCNRKKTPGSSSSCPCWCDCGWDSSSRALSIFRFSTYHSHPSSTCSQDLGRMRKVVAMSSSRTSLDIGFSLKMDRRAFVNLNLYVVFYWSSVCKRVVCFSLSYVLSVKLCGKNVKTYIKDLACCDPTLHKPGRGRFIPDICHERHEYIRVNLFWLV